MRGDEPWSDRVRRVRYDVMARTEVEIRGWLYLFLREYRIVEKSWSTKHSGYPLQSRWCLKVEIVLLVEMVHLKCMVRWQELSLHCKTSRDFLKPDHSQRMLRFQRAG